MAEPFVTVATFPTAAEAELARNLLSEEGLNAFLADAETVGMLWHVGGALGGVKLQVAAGDEPRARNVLRRRARWPEESNSDDYGTDRARGKSIVHSRPYDELSEDDGEPVHDEPSEGDEIQESRADAIARRAWRSAVIGLLLFPPVLHFYSVGLLLQLLRADDPLSGRGKWAVLGALAVDVLVGMVVWYVFVKGGI